MRIAIEINGVLRNTINKIEQTYQKYYIDKTDGIEDEIFSYGMSLPVTSLTLQNHFKFQDDDELFSFLYEEFPMEIFGHSQSSEYSTFTELNELYVNLRDNHELLIVSDEIGRSKPASLFFLSKFGCLLEKVIFFSEITKNNMWNQIDILLTADPILLLEKPVGKIVVKFNTSYNKQIKSDYEISSLSEFEQIIQNLKQNV